MDRAACKGADPKLFDITGDKSYQEMHAVTEEYCLLCPVAQECLDDAFWASPDGVEWDSLAVTIRGGYVPTEKSPIKRGRPTVPKKCSNGHIWTPETTDYSPTGAKVCIPCRIARLENKTECRNGHPWVPENIIEHKGGRRCRTCRNNERPSTRTHCTRGHEFTPENSGYSSSGKDQAIRRYCKTCKYGAAKAKRAREGRHKFFITHCKKGHLRTPENTYVSPKTGKKNCKTCKNARRVILAA